MFLGAILVHCAAGVSRSSTVVCAYLMKSKQMSAKDAVLHVHKKRSCICPNSGFMGQLFLYEQELQKQQAAEKENEIKQIAWTQLPVTKLDNKHSSLFIYFEELVMNTSKRAVVNIPYLLGDFQIIQDSVTSLIEGKEGAVK